MERYKDYFSIGVIVLLIMLLIVAAGYVVELSNIKDIMQKQLDYQIEMQFCTQDAMEYLAPCRLEMDTDGSVHWYFNPEEGRI